MIPCEARSSAFSKNSRQRPLSLEANIFISASHEARVARLCAMHHISEEEAENMMSKADKKRSEYYNYYSYKTILGR